MEGEESGRDQAPGRVRERGDNDNGDSGRFPADMPQQDAFQGAQDARGVGVLAVRR